MQDYLEEVIEQNWQLNDILGLAIEEDEEFDDSEEL